VTNDADKPQTELEGNAKATENEAVETLEPVAAETEALQAEIAKLKDTMLREQADLQNQRKRLQRDVENARKFALERFVNELLPVVDNLERAIDAAVDSAEVKPLKDGVELTHKQFLDVLAKFNVQQLNPVGEPFDPQYHEAVTMVPNPAMEPNSVMDVMQKGYTLNDRLLRAAMVVVSKEA